MLLLRSIFTLLGIILISLVRFIWEKIKEILIPLKYQMKDIAGEIALVTGGGGGLGRSIALELSSVGAIVVIWDINEKGIEKTVKLVQNAGGICYGYVCDLLNREEIYKKAAQLTKEVGQVTILVNNAGVSNVMLFEDIPDNLLLHTFNLNIISHLWTVKAFLPAMIESNKGHIVGIASIAGYLCAPLLVDYCTSKHAIVGFYKALDIELNFSEYKINITTICPSFIRNTGMKAEDYLRFPLPSPKEIAIKTVIAIRCNKKNVILPGYVNILLFFARMFPYVYLQLIFPFIKLFTSDKLFMLYKKQTNQQSHSTELRRFPSS